MKNINSYAAAADYVCATYGLEDPITISVMAMIEKMIDIRIITALLIRLGELE